MRAPTAVHRQTMTPLVSLASKKLLLVFVDGEKIFWDDEGRRELMRLVEVKARRCRRGCRGKSINFAMSVYHHVDLSVCLSVYQNVCL